MKPNMKNCGLSFSNNGNRGDGEIKFEGCDHEEVGNENMEVESRDASHSRIMLPRAWDKITAPQLIKHIESLNIEPKRKTILISSLQRNFQRFKSISSDSVDGESELEDTDAEEELKFESFMKEEESRDASLAGIMLPRAWDKITAPQLIKHIESLNIEHKRKTKLISSLQRNVQKFKSISSDSADTESKLEDSDVEEDLELQSFMKEEELKLVEEELMNIFLSDI